VIAWSTDAAAEDAPALVADQRGGARLAAIHAQEQFHLQLGL
jgi:hypothetical protein